MDIQRQAKWEGVKKGSLWLWLLAEVHVEVQEELQADQEAAKGLTKLETVLEMLVREETLSEAMRDHPLGGTYRGYREYRIELDWLLIYRIDGAGPSLVAMHSRSRSGLLGLQESLGGIKWIRYLES